MNTNLVRDLYAETTARIIAALEQGHPVGAPWSQDVDSMPVNAGTRRPYRGINALLLALEATSHGYPLNRWLTYRQASELGGQVRKGEHGTTVVFGGCARSRPPPTSTRSRRHRTCMSG